jgi:hypothetical protein
MSSTCDLHNNCDISVMINNIISLSRTNKCCIRRVNKLLMADGMSYEEIFSQTNF